MKNEKITIFSNLKGTTYSVKWFTFPFGKYDRECHSKYFKDLKSAETYAEKLKN